MVTPDITCFHDTTEAWRVPEISDRRFQAAVARVAPEFSPEAVETEILDHLRGHGPSYAKDLLRARFQHGGQTPRHLEWPTIIRFMIPDYGNKT